MWTEKRSPAHTHTHTHKWTNTLCSDFAAVLVMLRRRTLLMWRRNCSANGHGLERNAPSSQCICCLMGFTSSLFCLSLSRHVCVCSGPARRQLLGGDVQAGSPFRVPLHRARLLEGSHHWRRARHHSRLHYDHWNFLQGGLETFCYLLSVGFWCSVEQWLIVFGVTGIARWWYKLVKINQRHRSVGNSCVTYWRGPI